MYYRQFSCSTPNFSHPSDRLSVCNNNFFMSFASHTRLLTVLSAYLTLYHILVAVTIRHLLLSFFFQFICVLLAVYKQVLPLPIYKMKSFSFLSIHLYIDPFSGTPIGLAVLTFLHRTFRQQSSSMYSISLMHP